MKPTDIRPVRILHIEQDAKYAHFVHGSLAQIEQSGLEFVLTADVDAAMVQLAESDFDVVLIDPAGADGDVLQSCRDICVCAGRIPAIVLTANVDESLAFQSMGLGIQDYLIKGQTDGEALLKAIHFAIERSRQNPIPHVTATPSDDGALKILLVEDSPGDALLIEENLSSILDDGGDVVTVNRLDEALKALASSSFSAAVLGLSLPDSRGLETCVALRERAPGLPFIVHSGSDDAALALKTIQHGASDYLVKGRASGHELVRSVCFAIQRQYRGRQLAAQATPPIGELASRRNVSRENIRRSQTVVIPECLSTDRLSSVTPKSEQRTEERYLVVRSALAIPIGLGGRPDWDARLVGVTVDLSRKGLNLELEVSRLTYQDYMVGIERRDGVLCYAGLEVVHADPVSPRRLRVGGQFGGRGHEILAPASLSPKLDPASMRLTHPVAADVLAAWCKVGVMRLIPLDWVQVCPRCSALPTFRPGCRSCGSGRIAAERLIHHFACAHVGPFSDYEHADSLVCPKCRTRNLIVGSDFEYQPGLVRCQDCHWSGAEPEQVGQCLLCEFRFPGRNASRQELTAYHVHRLDPLAFISAP